MNDALIFVRSLSVKNDVFWDILLLFILPILKKRNIKKEIFEIFHTA